MKKKMEIFTHEEMLDRHIGKRGTPERESFENKSKAYVFAHRLKKLSKKKNLTRAELIEKIEVYKKEALEM